jgi:hypothetical protein
MIGTRSGLIAEFPRRGFGVACTWCTKSTLAIEAGMDLVEQGPGTGSLDVYYINN